MIMTKTALIVAVMATSSFATPAAFGQLLSVSNVVDTGISDGGTKAPAVVSGDNIYIAWWTNNTENGNQEVMFRASNDGGATFSNKTNLSNTTDADSWRVEIAGEGDSVVVTWWETNQTSDVPVARVSTDGGATFGPMVMLTANGTVTGIEEEATEEQEGEDEDEEEATAEGVIEEAVGGPQVAE
jgi:hypothetical protein